MKYLPLLLIVFTFSCQNEQQQSTQKKYYDLANFINTQVKQLTDNQPVITKNLLIDGKSESIKTNKIDWAKELELFIQADLNKQAYQNSYEVNKTDSSVVYQLKIDEKLPVKSLKIDLDKSQSPTNIEAVFFTENYLYESNKTLKMSVLDGKMQNYSIKGSQELFIGDKKEFEVVGKNQ